MLRWFFRLIVLAMVAFGFYHIAFREVPMPQMPVSNGEILAANMPGRVPTQPEIRVLVAEAINDAVLTINGRVRMEAVTMQMKRERGEFTQSVAVDVTPTGKGIKVGAELYVRIRIKSLDSQPLRLEWMAGTNKTTINLLHEIEIYGTHVVVDKRQVPKIRVLARLPMEEYLYGVVPGEMPTNWPQEALRTQAVASRTFAYFEVKSRVNEEYDVHASTRSQVWRPTLAVEPQVRRAVDSTAGIVVTEKNALIKTFFHSECGGFTADARWVFTKTPILALSGVRCPRCSNPVNKPTAWSATYTHQEIATRLRRAGVLRQTGNIRLIQALDAHGNPLGRDRNSMTRVVTMEITFEGGSGVTVRIPANDFRAAMGSDRKNIASTYMFLTDTSGAGVTFSGLGWGHGVGMCQHGAAYAAEKLGYNFLDIIALYYPGSKPVRLWGR